MNTYTLERQYRSELASIPDAKHLTQQQKDSYVARARSGDRDARNALVTQLLQRVASYANVYYSAYSWASPLLSRMDLVQAGNIAILEHVDRVLASAHENPYAYLTVAAYQAIRLYAKRYSSMIVTPHTVGITPIYVESLDAPLPDDSGGTLYDLVADRLANTSSFEMYSQTLDFAPLYQAINDLGVNQRKVIIHSFGLFGQQPLLPQTIERSILNRRGAAAERAQALDRLRRQLASAYPQLCTSVIRPPLRPAADMSTIKLTPAQIQRLEQAYADLFARDEKITIDRLRKAAHIAPCYARKYLHQVQPPLTNEQRLKSEYDALAADGKWVSAEQLAKKAGVRAEQASAYLSARRGPEPTQDERLEKAYTHMQANGEKITVRTLGKESRVEGHKVASWLKARRLAEGLRPIHHGGMIRWQSTEYAPGDSPLLPLECAWCLAEQSIKPTSGSHGICIQHAEQVMHEYQQRRGRS